MTHPPIAAAKILIVDDVPDNLRLLARILELKHYTVRKALSGKMALQSVQRDCPDLILLDINMPEMNGYQVCQQLKAAETTRHIPIIFISAMDQVNSKVEAFAAGGQDYITKPFEELEVLARIHNQLLICAQQQQLQDQKQRLSQQNTQLEQEIQQRQQAEQEVRQLNADLERRVRTRTLELRQSLKFAATLKTISDKVRDSLDQQQILQSAVEQLAMGLECDACHVVIPLSPDTAGYLHCQAGQACLDLTLDQLLSLATAIGIQKKTYHQPDFTLALGKDGTAFMQVAVLVCPVFDPHFSEQSLGHLWLFRSAGSSFGEMEIDLVQQVSSQCAIALRQARLYAAAQDQIQALQRLNQLKDDFLSTVSHELRTPIATMKMVLRLLVMLTDEGRTLPDTAKGEASGNKAREYLAVLQEECDRELALVEDLLSLQHLEADTSPLQLIPLDLNNWLSYVAEPFEARTHNHQQRLQIDLPANLPILPLDSQALQRVLTELLSNACKYTPAGEIIQLSAHLNNTPHCLELIVSNTGVIISPEELPRVFDKFYRIPNNDPWKHGGTGMGLALVKKMVERMGGAITAESDPSSTRFIVRLPCSLPIPDLAVQTG